MGLVRKNDEDRDYLEGVEVIGRGEGPDAEAAEGDLELAEGRSAEDISGTTERRAAENALETEPDPELLESADADGEDDEFDGEDADEFDDPEDDPDDEDEDDAIGPDVAGFLRTGTGKVYAAVLIIAVAVAAIAGYVLGGSGSGSSGSSGSSSSTTGVSSIYVTEDELDNVVATWTYDGTTYEVTVQEAIESEYSLETVQEEDGTYPAPTADTILTYVQNQVLYLAAEAEGISVDEDEAAEYAEETLGSSDYEYIAESYGLTEEQAEAIVLQMATIQALYESVIPEVDAVYPDAPEDPEDDEEDTATAEYAAYIIELAGDEWDAEAGTWASTDGDYYASLGDDFTGETATYDQALTAYYVAYTIYYEAYSEVSSVWSFYANELYGEAEITIYGLYA